jgi:hypothetical protein
MEATTVKMKCKCLYCQQEFELFCSDSQYERVGAGQGSDGAEAHLVWDWEDRCPHCYATIGLTLHAWLGERGVSEARKVEASHVELVEGYCLPDMAE